MQTAACRGGPATLVRLFLVCLRGCLDMNYARLSERHRTETHKKYPGVAVRGTRSERISLDLNVKRCAKRHDGTREQGDDSEVRLP